MTRCHSAEQTESWSVIDVLLIFLYWFGRYYEGFLRIWQDVFSNKLLSAVFLTSEGKECETTYKSAIICYTENLEQNCSCTRLLCL